MAVTQAGAVSCQLSVLSRQLNLNQKNDLAILDSVTDN